MFTRRWYTVYTESGVRIISFELPEEVAGYLEDKGKSFRQHVRVGYAASLERMNAQEWLDGFISYQNS